MPLTGQKAGSNKPINKVAKGRVVELYARKELEATGYLVEKKPRTRFTSPDFWGMFDFIALLGSTVRLIQIKSNPTDFYKARKEIREWKKEHRVNIPCETWLFLGRSRGVNKWRVEEV